MNGQNIRIRLKAFDHRILESLDLSPADRDRIFFRNLEAVTGRKLVGS